MQNLPLKTYYDVVVIGGGVGGLTAAALLSKAGLSVCVLEKEPHVGGYLAGFRRKNFRFDTAIHWLNQCGPGGLVSKLFDFLGTDHPTAVTQTRIRRYKRESADCLLTNNPDEWRDQLIRDFPAEKEGIIRFFKAAKKLGKSFKNFSDIFRSEETMTFFEKIQNKFRLLKFVIPFIPYVRYKGEKGLHKGLNRFFKDENLHKVFVADTELLGCLVPIGWAYYSDYQSPPKGGGQAIPEWLQYLVEYFKNDVRGKCSVTRILVEDNTCKGVAFTHRGNEYIVNSKYVIAACDIETLYEKMLPPGTVPDKLKSKLRNAELYSSSITISVALDCTAESLGFNEEIIHLASEQVGFDEHTGGDPAKTEISILAPSQRDKSLAPEGCGTLTLFMPAFMHHYNEWHTEKDQKGMYIRGKEYEKLKNEIAEVIINRVEEKVAPGLKSHILFYDIATPVTHWRYTGNKNGTMMGAKPGRENMQNKIAHYKTPVKNLLLGGHWAELGGGVPIAVKAGSNAALLILKKEKPEAFKSLAAYMDGKVTLNNMQDKTCFKVYDNSWVQELTPAQKAAALK